MHPKVVAEIHQATFSLAFSSCNTKASPQGSFTLDMLLKRSQIPLVRVLATQRGQSPLGWKLSKLGAIAWPVQVGSNGCARPAAYALAKMHCFMPPQVSRNTSEPGLISAVGPPKGSFQCSGASKPARKLRKAENPLLLPLSPSSWSGPTAQTGLCCAASDRHLSEESRLCLCLYADIGSPL